MVGSGLGGKVRIGGSVGSGRGGVLVGFWAMGGGEGASNAPTAGGLGDPAGHNDLYEADLSVQEKRASRSVPDWNG